MPASIDRKDIDDMSDEEIRECREYLNNCKAIYMANTGKNYIFADELSPDQVEEHFFHENIHGILHDLYGEASRGIAERFWDIAPEEGKVSKDYIRGKYEKEKQKEELFTFWLSRSMRDVAM